MQDCVQIKVSDVALFAAPATERAAARQLPGGQEPGSNGQVEEPAVPPSWVAVLSGEEELHRLRADEGIPLRLEGQHTSNYLLQSIPISTPKWMEALLHLCSLVLGCAPAAVAYCVLWLRSWSVLYQSLLVLPCSHTFLIYCTFLCACLPFCLSS